MNELPSVPLPFLPQPDGTTGRLVVTFRQSEVRKGMRQLKRIAGVKNVASAAEFANSAIKFDQVAAAAGTLFPKLGIAVCDSEPGVWEKMLAKVGGDSAILAVEPERRYMALDDEPRALAYLSGYRDAISRLMSEVSVGLGGPDANAGAAPLFADDPHSTWGLKAMSLTGQGSFTGQGVKVAILDTGLDEAHPDFFDRLITAESFIAGENAQDQLGHGTHCTGIACGALDADGRRYGIASEAEIFVGKVLGGPFGSGTTPNIVAGIEWAIANGCRVISLSLGADIRFSSAAMEADGRRALDAGALVVAAAGNNARRPLETGFVGQPANCASMMAVSALNPALQVASFSSRAVDIDAGAVDIAAPGVAVYSSWPLHLGPAGYRTLNGTSMATPAVAGIAALFAEATAAQGAELWQLLVSHRRALLAASADVGVGLTQAPI